LQLILFRENGKRGGKEIIIDNPMNE